MPDPTRLLPFRRIAAAAAIAALLVAGAAHAQEDRVVATVNGHPVTEAELDLMASELDQQMSRLPAAQRRAAALTAVIEIRLIADRAVAAGMADTPEFQQRMEMLRQRALHSAYVEENIAAGVTDEALLARYEQEIADIEPEEEVRARHIIVEDRDAAVEIIAALDAGGDFEELAREHSMDGAAGEGGDLGFFGRGRMVKEFEEAAFGMEVGQYTSEPVESRFGWHVIQLVDRRQQELPGIEEVGDQLRSLMLREAYFDAVVSIREAAEIEVTDPELKEAMDAIEAAPVPR